MNRRDFLVTSSSAAAVVIAGRASAGDKSSTADAANAPAGAGRQAGPGLPLLTLHSSRTGRLPYLATAFPLEGAVPAGHTIESPDDPTISSSIVSTWPDGSAQVVVLAGAATITSGTKVPIRLRPGTAQGAPLTTSYIATRLNGISVDFGAGQQTLKDFSGGHDFVWWANRATICARYRLPCGMDALEAVIDVHAFSSGHVFVEVIIENGRVDADAATVMAPSNLTYANATVAVNGTNIAAVSSPTPGMRIPNSRRVEQGYSVSGVYQGGHEPFRAWYCAAEVLGESVTASDHHALFGIEVTHDTASLQAHPWFFKPAEESSQLMRTKYAQPFDTYVPWATCRLRMPAMSGGGDDQQIAMYSEEQSDYVVTGDTYARRAVLATGLACHSANFNWRHTNGRLPTRTQMIRKSAAAGSGNGKWPDIRSAPAWGSERGTVDGSHVPFVGLVPFLCRPSPCFIELAQKEFCWHATNYRSPDAATHPGDQIRSRAWRLRNYAGAIFLTPDADYDNTGRKASLRAALAATIPVNRTFLDRPWNSLRVIYGGTVSRLNTRVSNFMNHFCVMSWTTIERVKVLRGADQSAWEAMCDRFCDLPVRYVNQANSGEWRAILYYQYLGAVAGTSIDMGPGDFGERNRIKYGPDVPAPTGPWLMDTNDGTVTEWATMKQISSIPKWGVSSYNYDAIFWSAFCASVERGGPGADAAWKKVLNGITNLDAWKTGFRTYPRFNRWPRNK